MELQFDKRELGCIQMLRCRVQNVEETAEVRLDDMVPPASRVICAWGQPLLRGKQWRSDAVQVTGGVMAWVLYAAEDGSSHCVQAWVPIQTKMDIPASERDGTVMADLALRSVDARSIHERKLLVRVDVAVQLQCAVPCDAALYDPGELPEDVQLKKALYPAYLPMEMGEKEFSIDEILDLPGACPALGSVVCYRLQPELIDRKVMADKVVFRGMGLLHLVYKAEDGQLCSHHFELPFSQYAELSGQYEQTASARILPSVTSLELETEDGRLHVQAGLVGQYLIRERKELTVAEDAYSTRRELTPCCQQIQLPVILDSQLQTQHCELTQPSQGARVLDVAFLPDQPAPMRTENGQELELAGKFQVLYAGPDGEPEAAVYPWDGQLPLGADESCRVDALVGVSGVPVATLAGGSIALRADMGIDAACGTEQTVSVICGLQLEERKQEADERPAVVLRRAGQQSLWEMAKAAGSTVDAIMAANGLTGDPAPDRMLLIPLV